MQQKINELNGHVNHYEIKNKKNFQQQINTSVDTSCNIYNVSPMGVLKIKIPRANADEFITYVLQMKGELSSFLLDEEDITEDIEATKDLTNMYAGVKDKKNIKIKTSIATSEEYIVTKKELKKQTYKSSFLWFDVNLKGNNYIYKEMIANAQTQRSPLWYSFTESVKSGAYFCVDILLGILKIWPAILLIVAVIIISKKYIFNRKPQFIKQ
jgi:hypothetical protein